MNDHHELVEKFIASFAVVAETLDADEILDPIAWRLATGPSDECGHKRWSPIKVQTDAYALEPLYAKLPARFPPLYEQLLLSYRWAEVDLQSFTLLANSPGEGLFRIATTHHEGQRTMGNTNSEWLHTIRERSWHGL